MRDTGARPTPLSTGTLSGSRGSRAPLHFFGNSSLLYKNKDLTGTISFSLVCAACGPCRPPRSERYTFEFERQKRVLERVSSDDVSRPLVPNIYIYTYASNVLSLAVSRECAARSVTGRSVSCLVRGLVRSIDASVRARPRIDAYGAMELINQLIGAPPALDRSTPRPPTDRARQTPYYSTVLCR